MKRNCIVLYLKVIKMLYCADFETITDDKDCRVWAWGICEIPFVTSNFGNSIDSFFDYLKTFKKNSKIYFHNLKFDGSFILNYLLSNNYEWVKDKKELGLNKFTTMISDDIKYYNITYYASEKVKIEFYDSMKIINLPVAQIAKSFGMPFQKESIDYDEYRDKNHILTDEEKLYLTNDIKIVATALDYFFEQNLKKMTQGSNALYNYKQILGGEKKFRNFFPLLDNTIDSDIRKAYRGGFTYLNPAFAGKIIKKDGYVIDYNSLYPSVMLMKPLPYSQPVFFEGQYEYDKKYPLYIQHIRAQFELKKNKIPTIQLKNNLSFMANEYLTSSGYEYPELFLTNIDLCLFLEHYDVYNLEFINGWKFRGQTGMFDEYINKWSKVKVESKLKGNKGMAMIAKLLLNSLYGKFGTAPIGRSKKPILKDGVLHFEKLEEEERKPVYIPAAVFITSWARNETIRSAQKIYETGNYIYSDTDSIHAFGEVPNFIKLDNAKLGHWKQEFVIKYCKYLRQKCYVDYGHEPNENKMRRNITVAGLPKSAKRTFTIKKFAIGATYEGKLQPKQVQGGVVLKNTDFTIKGLTKKSKHDIMKGEKRENSRNIVYRVSR